MSLVSRTLGGALHIVAIWCFGFLAVLQFVRLLDVQRGAALLLPLVPAALAAVAYLRSRVFRSFLSISFALPVLGRCRSSRRFRSRQATRPRRTCGSHEHACRPGGDGRVPGELAAPSGRLDRRGAVPELRPPRETATWYPRATTVHEFTTQAVPAVLTGQLPHKGELPTLNDHPQNLFTLLGARYALQVIEPVTRLCPTRYCPDAHVREPFANRARGLLYDTTVGYLYRVLPASLREGLPPIGDRWGGFDDAGDAGTRQRLLGALDVDDVNLAIERADHQPRTEFARFLRMITPGAPARTLYFLHLMLPHAPYRLLPSGHEYGNAETIDGIQDDAFNEWAGSQLLADQARQRHLLQVGYTDRLLGDLVPRLKAAGLYDRALVVVTADHGASFHAGGFRRTVAPKNIADIASVPLFVKYPGQHQGVLDRRNARTIDVVPTIADVLGVTPPWKLDGASLRGAPVQGRRVTVWRRSGGASPDPRRDVGRGARDGPARRRLFGGEPTGRSARSRSSSAGRSARSVRRRREAPASGSTARCCSRTCGRHPSSSRRGSQGRWRRVARSRCAVAIAVNGRVGATTRMFVVDGRSRFAVLVPESASRGRNTVEVFAISSGRRAALAGSGNVQRRGLPAVRERQSAGVPERGPDLGRTGQARRADRVLDAGGRHGSDPGVGRGPRDSALVDRVLLFSGGKLVYSSATTVFRWDVDEMRGKSRSARVGFVTELPVSDVRGKQLRAFAVEGNIATELAWPKDRTSDVIASPLDPDANRGEEVHRRRFLTRGVFGRSCPVVGTRAMELQTPAPDEQPHEHERMGAAVYRRE